MIERKKIKYYRYQRLTKRKRSVLKNRFFWLSLFILILAGLFFYFLFFSSIFQVNKIIITGEKKISEENLKLLVKSKLENKICFFPGKNIFLINLEEIKKEILNKFPPIGEVEIGRKFPQTINILIKERKEIGIWCQEENCFLIDNQGIIFEQSAKEGGLIKIRKKEKNEPLILGRKVVEKERLSKILKIKTQLEENLKISSLEALIVSEERLNIKTSEGWEAYFSLTGDLDWQIKALGLILTKQIPPEKRKKLEYIDLRFSRVYYKFQP